MSENRDRISANIMINADDETYDDNIYRPIVNTKLVPIGILSLARANMSVASAGSKIVFAGGYENRFGAVSRMDIYDTQTNSWSIANLSAARERSKAIAAAGNKIFFAGGYDLHDNITATSDIIDIYDNNSRSWSKASLNFAAGASGAVTDGQNIYWSLSNGCYVETFNLGSKTSAGSPLYRRGAFYSVIKDGEIIFLRDGSNLFDIYNPSSNQRSVGKLPSPLPSRPAIISVNNIIYIAGGQIDCTPVNGGCIPVPTNQVYKLEF